MTRLVVDLTNKHMQIVLKHGEETGLQFDDALIDLIEVHADNKENAVRATLKAVQAVQDTGESGMRTGKSIDVPLRTESSTTIQDVYAIALTMPLDEPFTIFDVIERMEGEKLQDITEDQMRGWGTPFSNWVNKRLNIFKVVEGNPQPRKYVRYDN